MSFMKPLAGPLAGAAVSMIPGGAAFAPLVSSAIGGAMAQSPNSTALNPVSQGMQAGYGMAGTMGRLAGQAFNPVVDYWSRILSPNRSAAMSALAPEIARMGDQTAAEMKAQQTLMPRGGGQASIMSQLPYQNMAAVQSMFQSLRPQAAQGLGQIGASLGALGVNALNAGTAAGRDIMQYQLQKQLYDRALGQSMGGAAADAFKALPDFSKLLGLGRGGGGTQIRNLPGSTGTIATPNTPPFAGGTGLGLG